MIWKIMRFGDKSIQVTPHWPQPAWAKDEDADEISYVISTNQMALPGCYADERAARYAFRFTDADLSALQESVNPGGTITFAMLQDLRKRGRRRANERAG